MTAAKSRVLSLSPKSLLISNLKTLMRTHNINEATLARETQIPQATLHKILSGKTSDPRISTLKVLADHFMTSLDDLYIYDMSQGIHEKKSANSIPIISWQDCINSPAFIESLTTTNWEHWLVMDRVLHKSSYALSSKPCMEPRFPRGTILTVDPEILPDDGDLVIVHYPDTSEATLRELSQDGPVKMLLSYNQNISPEQLTKKIKIIGTVIQSRFTYQ